MLNINKKAFTLVELIVVITILAILGTIGFISLQGYSSEARDSKRVTDLGQIRTGIQVYQAKEGVVPEPSEIKTIIGSGTTNLIIQGYAGTGVLNNIRVNNDAKDPLEDNYYTYSTNGAKTKFQLLALLENQETAYNNVIPTTYADYETRDLYTVGDKLGILLDSTTNIPVQELGETEVDLSTNTTEYKTVFSKSDIQTLSGTSLHQEIVTKSDNTGVEEENIVYSSCKEILDNGASTGDGTYTIDPENNGVGFEIYCDMTTDGGGWTRIEYNIGANGAAEYNPIPVNDKSLTYNDVWISYQSGMDDWATPVNNGTRDWVGWGFKRNTIKLSDGNFYWDSSSTQNPGANDYTPNDMNVVKRWGYSSICYYNTTNVVNDLSHCAKDFIVNVGENSITAIHDVEANMDSGDLNNSISQVWDIYVR